MAGLRWDIKFGTVPLTGKLTFLVQEQQMLKPRYNESYNSSYINSWSRALFEMSVFSLASGIVIFLVGYMIENLTVDLFSEYWEPLLIFNKFFFGLHASSLRCSYVVDV
jgi:hypothetical protein